MLSGLRGRSRPRRLRFLGQGPSAGSAAQEAPADAAETPVAPSGARRFWTAVDRGPQGKPWRVLTIVLLVVGCVIAPLGVTAAWAKNLVYNQDAYLAAVQPLVTDPVIVSAAEAAIVSGIDSAISNLNIADSIGTELQSLGLPPKLATLATGYLATFREDIVNAVTKMVDDLVESPKVADIWDKANAALHAKFVQVMQGQDGELHTLNVDLSSAVSQVKQKLTSSGVQWAAQIPDVPVVFNIAGNADVQRVAGYYDLLGTLGTWLPITRHRLVAAVDTDCAQSIGRSVESGRLVGRFDGGAGAGNGGRPGMADVEVAAAAAGHPGLHPPAHRRSAIHDQVHSDSSARSSRRWPGCSAVHAAPLACAARSLSP